MRGVATNAEQCGVVVAESMDWGIAHKPSVVSNELLRVSQHCSMSGWSLSIELIVQRNVHPKIWFEIDDPSKQVRTCAIGVRCWPESSFFDKTLECCRGRGVVCDRLV